MKVDTERRSGTRIATRVPTRVRNAHGADHTAQTRDVSANGIFLYTKSRMEKGTDVELVLILPPELTSGEKCWVCCHARVLRVEQGSGKDFGVAAEIRRIDDLITDGNHSATITLAFARAVRQTGEAMLDTGLIRLYSLLGQLKPLPR